jgi:class 3 adenylate cyclase
MLSIMGVSRKRAAILAADVAGFSRLTGNDEDRTQARLRALRSDLIDPTIAVHNGRVVKRTGGGALCGLGLGLLGAGSRLHPAGQNQRLELQNYQGRKAK